MKRKAAVMVALVSAACGGGAAQTQVASPPPVASAPAATVSLVAAGDPPPVVDGDVTSGTVNGVTVIVKRTPGAAFVAAHLYVRGGARNWTAQNAGIENLAIVVAASGGTKSLDKTAFSRKLAALGAQIWGEAGNDFSELAVKAPVEAWDDSFSLLADVFRNPALPASEVELARAQALAELHHEQEDPDGQLWTLERAQIFAGHPYANRPIGTLESVAALKAEDLAPYLDKLRDPSRLVFVAAGDVDAAHVFDQVRHALGDLPRGSYVDTPLPPLAFSAPHLATAARKLPTNYIESVFLAPRWTDADFVAGRVAMSALSWRLWQEVRTKRNLTYAVSAHVNDGLSYPLGTLYVTAVDPNTTFKVMLDEVKRLQNEPIGDLELAGFKSVFLTGYLERHETPDGQVHDLADAQLYAGDWRIARGVADRVRAVTAADVQAFARKYFVHMQAAVVGDPAKLDAGLFTGL